jgi:hypothetical protein
VLGHQAKERGAAGQATVAHLQRRVDGAPGHIKRCPAHQARVLPRPTPGGCVVRIGQAQDLSHRQVRWPTLISHNLTGLARGDNTRRTRLRLALGILHHASISRAQNRILATVSPRDLLHQNSAT